MIVFWFRRDLRLEDNIALAEASEHGPVLPLFIVDPAFAQVGDRRRAYLGQALNRLRKSIADQGGELQIVAGQPLPILRDLAQDHAARIFATADYTPRALRRDRELAAAGVQIDVVDSPFLFAPGTVAKSDGSAYSVFTPYYRATGRLPLPPPDPRKPRFATTRLPSEFPQVELPTTADIPVPDLPSFTPETLTATLKHYSERRNLLSPNATTRLGAALHFGEVHPRTILSATTGVPEFQRQLAWRDFYGEVISRQSSAWRNLDERFDRFPWRTDSDAETDFRRWQAGETGFPAVDAGMRQLAQEGWLPNRARMIVASFLVKDLLLPWQWGARYFLQQLFDADIANNNLGWQWVAGTGIDPSPFFRVFNPTLQAKKFDPRGDYIRRYVPELAALNGAELFEPWLASNRSTYPEPIVDHRVAREHALAALQSVQN